MVALTKEWKKYITGSKFIQYSDDLGKGAMDVKTIKEKIEFIFCCYKVQQNLSFRQEDVTEILRALGNDLDKFGFSQDLFENWLDITAKRIRCMLNHSRILLAKDPRPKWLADKFGSVMKRPAAGDKAEKEDSEEEEQVEEEQLKQHKRPAAAAGSTEQWHVGFSFEYKAYL